MRRALILIVLNLTVLQLKADEVLIRVTEDTPAWRSGTIFINNDTITKIIEKDTIGVGNYFPLLSNINDQPTPLIGLRLDGVVYLIDANYTVPADTEELVPQSLLTNWEDSDRKVWLLTHYIDVLRSGTRDTLKPYEQIYINMSNKEREIDEYDNEQWYEREINESFTIFQTGLQLGGISPHYIWILGVKTLSDSLQLTVRYPDYRGPEPPSMMNAAFMDLPLRNDPTPFNLYLIPDGDFLDIYIHDTDTLLTTLFHADQHVLKTLNQLMKYNRADISGITWPRRADGSSAYDNKIITRPVAGRDYRTAANLRLRTSQNTESEILLTIPKDTVVQVLDIGRHEIINDIDSNWVQVRLDDGTTGWCFGGYLHGPLFNETAVAAHGTNNSSESEISAEDASNLLTKAVLPGVSVIILAVVIIVLIVVFRKGKKNTTA